MEIKVKEEFKNPIFFISIFFIVLGNSLSWIYAKFANYNANFMLSICLILSLLCLGLIIYVKNKDFYLIKKHIKFKYFVLFYVSIIFIIFSILFSFIFQFTFTKNFTTPPIKNFNVNFWYGIELSINLFLLICGLIFYYLNIYFIKKIMREKKDGNNK